MNKRALELCIALLIAALYVTGCTSEVNDLQVRHGINEVLKLSGCSKGYATGELELAPVSQYSKRILSYLLIALVDFVELD
jgi:hypothetical protein